MLYPYISVSPCPSQAFYPDLPPQPTSEPPKQPQGFPNSGKVEPVELVPCKTAPWGCCEKVDDELPCSFIENCISLINGERKVVKFLVLQRYFTILWGESFTVRLFFPPSKRKTPWNARHWLKEKSNVIHFSSPVFQAPTFAPDFPIPADLSGKFLGENLTETWCLQTNQGWFGSPFHIF